MTQMQVGLIAEALFLLGLVTVFAILMKGLPFSRDASKPAPQPDPDTPPSPEAAVAAQAKPNLPAREDEPSAFRVVHLRDGMATVLVRERVRLGKTTGHLIVWAGKKRKGRRVLVEDSHYDLGYVDGCDLTEKVLAGFVEAANHRLSELVRNGMKKQRGKQSAVPAETPQAEPSVEPVAAEAVAPVAEVAPAVEPTVAIEENEHPDPAIKLKRYPSVFRGQVLEMGMLPKAGKDGEFNCYGVRYRTPEGVEDVVWGVNLRNAFHDAGAGVGDEVEILKIGRKTVEQGKAPMNLYKVTRLAAEQLQVQ